MDLGSCPTRLRPNLDYLYSLSHSAQSPFRYVLIGLGVTPSNDGKIIRVPLPPLTEERRKDYVKIVKNRAEDARVAVRNVRRSAKDDLEALKSEVGEDEVTRAEKELEAITKQFIEQVDEASKRKEAELMEV